MDIRQQFKEFRSEAAEDEISENVVEDELPVEQAGIAERHLLNDLCFVELLIVFPEHEVQEREDQSPRTVLQRL